MPSWRLEYMVREHLNQSHCARTAYRLQAEAT